MTEVTPIDWEALAKPFLYEELDWVGIYGMKSGEDYWLEIAPYVTARAIQDRLDSVVGKGKWRNTYEEVTGGLLCTIWLNIEEEWVDKADGAEFKGRDPLKTACSVALKRAGVQWGIGRYLYSLPRMFAEIKQNKSREFYRHTLKDKTVLFYMPDQDAIDAVKQVSGE